MDSEKISIPSTEEIPEKKVVSNPKYQVILSLIAYFQHNKKNIQRAHLIQALVKKSDHGPLQKDAFTNDKNTIEKGINDRLQTLGDISPKIMFNSIAHLDKTVQKLRKLGLITNQYMRGYPRIILTHKGQIVFYSLVYPSLIFKTIVELINKLH